MWIAMTLYNIEMPGGKNLSDTADGCIGCALAFETKEDAEKYSTRVIEVKYKEDNHE